MSSSAHNSCVIEITSKLYRSMMVLAVALHKYVRRVGWLANYDVESNLNYLINECRRGQRNNNQLQTFRIALEGRNAVVRQNVNKMIRYHDHFVRCWMRTASAIGDEEAVQQISSAML